MSAELSLQTIHSGSGSLKDRVGSDSRPKTGLQPVLAISIAAGRARGSAKQLAGGGSRLDLPPDSLICANIVLMATPPDPPRPSIRSAATTAVESSPELAENRLLKFLRTMSTEEEQLLEHLAELDLRENEAET